MAKLKPYEEQLLNNYITQLLDRLKNDPNVTKKQITLGAFANVLKGAHPSKEYTPMHNYLTGRGRRAIEEAGFLIIKEGQLVIKKMCLAQYENTYDACHRCRRRIKCLQESERPSLDICPAPEFCEEGK